jgi:hypothetical protein
MLAGHEQMIAATRIEIARGTVAWVRTLARQALPVMSKQLDMMRSLAGSG